MKQLARIIKDCGHRGKVGHIYEVIEKNPRDGFRLIVPGGKQFTFWYPEDCIEHALCLLGKFLTMQILHGTWTRLLNPSQIY